ncbi:hypothetical protein ACFOUP_00490 [Belliella kenyensis]|uniref:Uncharacterized protein n=1 Tax=Belliella kenyensis TaxID=1472724 RepID=A0ABV8EGD5_9BACT
MGDFFKTAFYDGGLDPTSSSARKSAWRDIDPTRKESPTNNAWNIDKGLLTGDLRQIVSKLTWELPQTLIGNLGSHGLNIAGFVNEVNHFKGATVLDTNLSGGAFSLGSYLIGPNGFKPDFRDHLFVHEFGHYLQSQRMGPLYLPFVALPSVTDFYLVDKLFKVNLHSTRWNEANASKLAANYFDGKFGTGASGYFSGSENHFDRNSFVNDRTSSPYRNPRNEGFNTRGNPIKSRFHWSDVPINMLFNGGLGLFGFLFNK